MPELPEVQTTVNGLNSTVRGRTIVNVSTTYNSPAYKGKDEIKNPEYFKKFKKKIKGKKITNVERRGKNILMHLNSGQTILTHMKMTGHYVYDRVVPHIRLDFELDKGVHLYLSDLRKFGKVTLIPTDELHRSEHLSKLGPEPLEENFQFEDFKDRLRKRPRGKIKQVLMDPKIIAGIGNIYSDEILWRAGVHPLSSTGKIPKKNLEEMYKAMKELLKKGILLGGDSMSDYRDVRGERGQFQEHHRAYQKHGEKCSKRSCKGVLDRLTIGARSAHFCPKHQKLYR